VNSPCVTFNNHEGSTKSYLNVKEHDAPLHDIFFIPRFENIEVDYLPGESREVTLHDGSRITLKKLGEDYDPSDALHALSTIHHGRQEDKFVTGLLYVDPEKEPFEQDLRLTEAPLASLPLERVRPSREVLEEVMASLMMGNS
jgi:2-oxoglutarate ferredoxin oxidoreductase subunit beta